MLNKMNEDFSSNFENLPENIKLVIQRIIFIDDLYSKRKDFQGELVHNFEFDFHPFKHFYSLVNYLLITCIDSLSQKDKFKDFGAWLNDDKEFYTEQLIKILETDKKSPIDAIDELYLKYKESYGVTRSIKELIFSSFNEDMRERLFKSIKASRRFKNSYNYDGKSEIIDELKKVNYLFDLRNKFTHTSFLQDGAVDFSNFNYNLFTLRGGDVYQMAGINGTKINETENKFTSVKLIGWPFVMREILADYIYLNFDFDIRLKMVVIFSFKGEYNFDLLWAENQKVLCARKNNGDIIYLGGSEFINAEQAIYYMKCKVSDAIQLDNSRKVEGSTQVFFSEFFFAGPISNTIGSIVSKGVKYYIRFDRKHKVFLFSNKKGSNEWTMKETTETDHKRILMEAKAYLDSL